MCVREVGVGSGRESREGVGRGRTTWEEEGSDGGNLPVVLVPGHAASRSREGVIHLLTKTGSLHDHRDAASRQRRGEGEREEGGKGRGRKGEKGVACKTVCNDCICGSVLNSPTL